MLTANQLHCYQARWCPGTLRFALRQTAFSGLTASSAWTHRRHHLPLREERVMLSAPTTSSQSLTSSQLQARCHQARHRLQGAPREALRRPEREAFLQGSRYLYVKRRTVEGEANGQSRLTTYQTWVAAQSAPWSGRDVTLSRPAVSSSEPPTQLHPSQAPSVVTTPS